MATSEPVLSAWNEERRLSGRNFTCVLCSQRWHEDDMRFQDGIESLRVCPPCYEPNGGTVARDEDRAAASELAAQLEAKESRPPQFPGWFEDSTVSAISTFSDEPLRLTAGGASDTLTIGGTGFASTDTIAYSHAGITDAVAPSITSTEVVLTVQASGAVPAGLYHLTYNGVLYRNVFDVRA